MPTKTLSSHIPSLKIDREFLTQLGSIIEAEILQALQENRDQILHLETTRSNTENHAEQLSLSAQIGTLMGYRPTVDYTLAADKEQLEFHSVAEIEQTALMPSNLSELTVHISPRKPQCVELRLRFNNQSGSQNAQYSSDNESALLTMKSKLDKLFATSRPGYHAFLIGPLKFAGPIALSILTSAVLIFLVVRAFWPQSKGDIRLFVSGLAFGSFWFLAMGLTTATNYLFPFYELSLGPGVELRATLRRYVMGILAALIFGVLGNVLYARL